MPLYKLPRGYNFSCANMEERIWEWAVIVVPGVVVADGQRGHSVTTGVGHVLSSIQPVGEKVGMVRRSQTILLVKIK